MPFISKDWRSPGEEWVKTQEGWEKKKVLECTAQRYPAITNNNNTDDSQHKPWSGDGAEGVSEVGGRVPPHCRIIIKCTKEVAGFTGLSEAVRRLDLPSAVRDARRTQYACALLELLVGEQRLPQLPAAAQKLVLSALEQLAEAAARDPQHLARLRGLLRGVARASDGERRACWGRPLGSRALWAAHRPAIARISRRADAIAIAQPGPEVLPKLHDLPEECIREILLKLSDHKDLEAAAGASARMAAVCGERRTWRELAAHHFTAQQRARPLPRPRARAAHPRDLFHHLRRMYGLREDPQFTETLSLCRHCKCLFWRSLGHPCIADQCPEYRARLRSAGGPLPPHPVPPAAFLKLFSL